MLKLVNQIAILQTWNEPRMLNCKLETASPTTTTKNGFEQNCKDHLLQPSSHVPTGSSYKYDTPSCHLIFRDTLESLKLDFDSWYKNFASRSLKEKETEAANGGISPNSMLKIKSVNTPKNIVFQKMINVLTYIFQPPLFPLTKSHQINPCFLFLQEFWIRLQCNIRTHASLSSKLRYSHGHLGGSVG